MYKQAALASIFLRDKTLLERAKRMFDTNAFNFGAARDGMRLAAIGGIGLAGYKNYKRLQDSDIGDQRYVQTSRPSIFV